MPYTCATAILKIVRNAPRLLHRGRPDRRRATAGGRRACPAWLPQPIGRAGESPCAAPARIGLADGQLLVDPAQDLVDARPGPQVEKGGGLHRGEIPHAALPRLLGALAGPGRLRVPPDPVVLVDRGVLDVAVQLPEVPRVDDRHRDRCP